MNPLTAKLHAKLQAQGIWNLNYPICKKKHLSTNIKSIIYKACVRPIMTYCAETRPELLVTKRILRTNVMNILKMITGYTDSRQKTTT